MWKVLSTFTKRERKEYTLPCVESPKRPKMALLVHTRALFILLRKVGKMKEEGSGWGRSGAVYGRTAVPGQAECGCAA